MDVEAGVCKETGGTDLRESVCQSELSSFFDDLLEETELGCRGVAAAVVMASCTIRAEVMTKREHDLMIDTSLLI